MCISLNLHFLPTFSTEFYSTLNLGNLFLITLLYFSDANLNNKHTHIYIEITFKLIFFDHQALIIFNHLV